MATEELISILTNYADDAQPIDYTELDLLFEEGANVNGLPHTDSPLMLAILANDFSLVSYLLDKGADANYTGGDTGITPSTTPLLFAVGSDDFPEVSHREAMVAVLLEFGADPDSTIDDQASALVQSILSKEWYLVDLLLEFDANPNLEYTYRNSTLLPIEWAILFFILELSYGRDITEEKQMVRRVVYSLRQKGSHEPSIQRIASVYREFNPRATTLPLSFLEYADELL